MSRITYELGHKGSGEYDTDNSHDMPANNFIKAINKLGRLEDIEELCEKVVSQSIYEKYEDTNKIHKEDYTGCSALYSFKHNRIELYFGDFVNYLELDQYGKTWALDKKELTNE